MALTTTNNPMRGGAETPTTNRLMSRREAAAYLAISLRMMADLLSKRAIGCIRIGGRTLVDRADLDSFIEAHREKSVGWKRNA